MSIRRFLLLFSCFLALACAQTVGYVVSTVAGIGRAPGDGGPSTSALLDDPSSIAVDAAGNVYITDFEAHRVRRVDSSGRIATIAGTGVGGYSGDNGPAVNAQISKPSGIAVDPAGNIYFGDNDSQVIRKIAPDGIISRFAGKGSAGFSGDGGPAIYAQLSGPNALAFSGGYLYIADTYNWRIRRVSPSGIITTVAGNGEHAATVAGGPGLTVPIALPSGLAFDSAGILYVNEFGYNRVLRIDSLFNVTPFAGAGADGDSGDGGDGGPALQATFSTLGGIAADSSGNIYVSVQSGQRIRKIANGTVTAAAGNGLQGFAGDGGSPLSAQFSFPFGISTDASGRLYVADGGNNRVRRVDFANSRIVTFAGSSDSPGDGGRAENAALFAPEAMAFDAAGNLFFADTNHHRIRKITPAGIINTVAGNGTRGFTGDGGDARTAQLQNPEGIAIDSAGNLFIADSGNARIRRVGANGIIQTVAGTGVHSFSGDLGPATLAGLVYPTGVATDAQGNYYIADYGNDRIRKVTSQGQISTFAGSNSTFYSGDNQPATSTGLSSPFSVAVDAPGNVYVSDLGHNRVRKISPGGTITTVAFLNSFANDLGQPFAIAVDSVGKLYITDAFKPQVRVFGVNGALTTIAGTGALGFAGDGTSALTAQFGLLPGIAVDPSGAVFVSDAGNHRIRKLTPVNTLPDFTITAAPLGGSPSLTLTSIGGFYGTVRIAVKAPQPVMAGSVSLPANGSVVFPIPQYILATTVTDLLFQADSGTLHHEATLPFAASVLPAVSSIYNSASFLSGGVAPGEAVAIFGTNLGPAMLTTSEARVSQSLAGVTVTFDDRPAPLLYVTANQLAPSYLTL